MKLFAKYNDARVSVIGFAILASMAISGIGLALAAGVGTPSNPSSAPSDQTGASAILQKMAAQYSKLNSLQVGIDASAVISMRGKKGAEPIRETLALQRPDQYAYSLGYGPADNSTGQLTQSWLSDGSKTINYNGPLKQYTSAPATSLAAFAAQNATKKQSKLLPASMLLLTMFSDSPQGQATLKLMGDGQVVGPKTLHGTPVTVLDYTRFSSPYFATPKGMKVFLAVDVNASRLVQATTVFPNGNMSMAITEAVRPASENQSLPASLFTFQPPADAKLVDKFQAPPASGAGDTAAKTAAQMIGKPAPDFSLNDTAGKTVDLNSLKGRTILMDFSASW